MERAAIVAHIVYGYSEKMLMNVKEIRNLVEGSSTPIFLQNSIVLTWVL